ncbi:hypothetical protein GIB67_004268, partial [Kingdonia uniflora]
TTCGDIPINYPFSIKDGCGSPYYRHLLICSNCGELQLRTSSGRYPILNITYSDPHIIVFDPFMWNCKDGDNFRPTRPFRLDTSTHLSLSSQINYLFFNCNKNNVRVKPKLSFCEQFTDRCDLACDSASYLCRNLPDYPLALGTYGRSSYYSYCLKAAEFLRLMLRYCVSYTQQSLRFMLILGDASMFEMPSLTHYP